MKINSAMNLAWPFIAKDILFFIIYLELSGKKGAANFLVLPQEHLFVP